MAGPGIFSRTTNLRTRISSSSPLAHPSRYRHLSSKTIASRLPTPSSLPLPGAQTDIPHSYRPIPTSRCFHTSTPFCDIPQWPNPPVPQPTVTPYSSNNSNSNAGGPDNNNNGGGGNGGKSPRGSVYAELAASPIVQAAVTTAIGLIAV